MSAPKTLAERVHEANYLMVKLESELVDVVEAACGETYSDEDYRTDGYDNSIEVWGVGEIDLGVAARKLKESGFCRVWLHQHPERENCGCPCR